MKRVELHPQAVEEAAAAYRWYADRNIDAAEKFADELDRAIERIGTNPVQYPLHLAGTRRFVFRTFPYLLVYRELDDRVEVIAVAHARRRPGYWANRMG